MSPNPILGLNSMINHLNLHLARKNKIKIKKKVLLLKSIKKGLSPTIFDCQCTRIVNPSFMIFSKDGFKK